MKRGYYFIDLGRIKILCRSKLDFYILFPFILKEINGKIVKNQEELRE
ncbi:hypothetical protein NLB65_02360 [Candidatus Aminicenantes bacterium AC-335-B20]|jgi:hypothetical protein|nr:hypothetical protein [Candidatus Aminicenantes bacterium AC-335-B20]MCP2620762.1 hypothetical protein [Candidatus Aminicenantes bacterium AC-334-E05]